MKLLSDIFDECRERFKLHLAAGGSGMGREVTWIYLAEDPGNLEFLRGGELIVTTGMTYPGDPAWLRQFVRALIDAGASGLILNTGTYLNSNDVDSATRELCNLEHFPLFMMSWEVHLADLMQDVSNQLFLQGQNEDLITGLFSDLLLKRTEKRDVTVKLAAFGFPEDASYHVLLMKGIRAFTPVRMVCERSGLPFHIIKIPGRYILVLQADSDENVIALTDEIFALQHSSRTAALTEGGLCIGMGEPETSLAKIRFSYLNAVNALSVAEKQGVSFFRFRELGIYQLLLSIEDTDMLHRLRHEYLDAIEVYDAENHTDYLTTLQLYLENDGSVNAVASLLYTHRNTVNYRMRKIRELLPFDMENADHLFMLKMALYVRNHGV